MKKIKPVICFILAIFVCTTAFCGCGKSEKEKRLEEKKEQKEQKVGNAKETDDTFVGDETIIVKGVGIDGTTDMFGYYLYQAATNVVLTKNPNADMNNVNWEEKDENGVTVEEEVKKRALKEYKQKLAIAKYAKDKGIGLTEDEVSTIKNQMADFQAKNGDDALLDQVKAIGIKTVEGYQSLYQIETIYEKFNQSFNENMDLYLDNKEELKKYKDEDLVSVQHILIKNDSEKYPNPKEEIQKVLQRAKEGESFDSLILEYNEDPGEGKAGYSFGRGKMVKEFEDASFALDYDQLSDVVESSYGYHIIKRVVGIAELSNYLESKADYKVNRDAVNAVSMKTLIAEIVEASDKLKNITR